MISRKWMRLFVVVFIVYVVTQVANLAVQTVILIRG